MLRNATNCIKRSFPAIFSPRNEKEEIPAFHVHTPIEKHTTSSDFVHDAIIGLADGLTVPFALTASLSSIGSSKLVILGGLAELFAGSISMGLGAYLAAITDARHYKVEEARQKRQVTRNPDEEQEIMSSIFREYGIGAEELAPVAEKFRSNPDAWVQFMMNFELRLESKGKSGPWWSALVMGVTYLLGGLIPMIPYFALEEVNKALFVSIGITVVMLLVFGYVKAIVVGTSRREALNGAFETLLVGTLAAGVSYGIVKAVDTKLD